MMHLEAKCRGISNIVLGEVQKMTYLPTLKMTRIRYACIKLLFHKCKFHKKNTKTKKATKYDWNSKKKPRAIVSYHFYGPSMSYARVAGLRTQKMLKKYSGCTPPLSQSYNFLFTLFYFHDIFFFPCNVSLVLSTTYYYYSSIYFVCSFKYCTFHTLFWLTAFNFYFVPDILHK